MTEGISYTSEEVAKILKISKYTVYELIKRGELAAYHIGRKVRIEDTDLEIYKQKAKGLTPEVTPRVPSASPSSTPETINPIFPTGESLVICGQDIVLDILTRHLSKESPHIRFLRQYIGSIDGLIALYRGLANVVTTHLWDSDTNEYNTPYVRRLMPGHKAVIINLVYRTEGFYVAKGNLKNITAWTDLTRPDLRFINRERGSGARVLLDEQLRAHAIDRKCVNGYDDEAMSHVAVASKVARSEADAGLGIEMAALQVNNVDFVPLQKERYDLVIREEDIEKPQFKTLISMLKSPSFQNEILGIGSYDVSKMGEIIAVV